MEKLSFEKFMQEMAVAQFGGDKGHKGKNLNDIPWHYANWMLSQIEKGSGNFKFSADDGSGNLTRKQVEDAIRLRVKNVKIAPTSVGQPIRPASATPTPAATQTTSRQPDQAQPQSDADHSKYLIPADKISKYQKDIEDAFANSKQHLVINALAGTGKSTVLKHLAAKFSGGKKWLYLVFNKKNAEEATRGEKAFPPSVDTMTSHQFLGRVLANTKRVKPELLPASGSQQRETDKYAGTKIDKIMDHDWFFNVVSSVSRGLESYVRDKMMPFNRKKNKYNVAFVLKKKIAKIVGLAKNLAIDPRKPDAKEKLNDLFTKYGISGELYEGSNDTTMPDLTDEFIDMTLQVLLATTPKGKINDPVLDTRQDFDDLLWWPTLHPDEVVWPSSQQYEVALVDEVQDFNNAQKVMLENLAKNGIRIVVVGDPNQCVVEGTLIETSNGLIPIENIQVGMEVLAGKGKGKKVNAKVTDVYVKSVDRELIKITTKNGKVLTTTPEHMHFAGYESNSTPRYFVYLMYKENMGYRVGITKNTRSKTNKGFKCRLAQERADKIWLIDQFASKAEAQIYEQYYSIKYGIPSIVFYKNADQKFSQDQINELFFKLDTESAAMKLLDDKNMSLDKPHHTPKSMSRKRYRNFNIVLCGDPRGTGLHRYSIAGTEKINLNQNIKVRKAKHGWRLESSHTELGKIYEILNELAENNEINVIEKARLTDVTLPYTPASHVMVGMDIFISEGENISMDVVSKVETVSYSGKVYDINVDKLHNFIANGIVTHNSIYFFRGSDAKGFSNIESMLKKTSTGASSHALPVNYRSGKKIIDYVNKNTHVKDLKAGRDHEGEVNPDMEESQLINQVQNEMEQDGKLKQETAFISKNNAPLFAISLGLLKNNIPFQIIGDDFSDEILDFIYNVVGNDKTFIGKNEAKYVSIDSFSRMLDNYIESKNEKFENQKDKEKYLQDLNRKYEALVGLIDYLKQQKEQNVKPQTEHALNEAKKVIETAQDLCDHIQELFKGLNPDNERDAQAIKNIDKTQKVILTTAHKSKGLEFERVNIVGDELFPHTSEYSENLGEEEQQKHNLKYVAYTRATHTLNISKSNDKN